MAIEFALGASQFGKSLKKGSNKKSSKNLKKG
jgi:hypothetical protein